MSDVLVSAQAVLDALHEQLPYPTEACAIVRIVAAAQAKSGLMRDAKAKENVA